MSVGRKNVKVVELQADKRWALNGGPFGSKLSSKHYSEQGVPVIRGKNLSGPMKFSFEDFVYVSEEKADELQANNAHPGDLIFTQRGTLGQVGLIPLNSTFKRFVISQSQMKLTVDESKADPLFLYYYFTFERTVQDMHNMAFSSGVPHINLGLLREYEVDLPDLPTQRRIAGILSAYDDLIENNLRRIRILEEMAQSLYREWFVHFRIPPEVLTQAGLPPKLTLRDSPLGPIPEGWATTNLKDLTSKIGSGATPRGGKDAYKSEGISLIRSLNVFDYNFKHAQLAFIDDDQAEKLKNVSVEEYDVLLNITGASVARCTMVPQMVLPARVNQHVAIIRSKRSLDSFFILDTINSSEKKKHILALAQGGATREALTKTTIENLQLVISPNEILEAYGTIRRNIFNQSQNLARKNQTLRQTRDLLLPKLLSPSE